MTEDINRAISESIEPNLAPPDITQVCSSLRRETLSPLSAWECELGDGPFSGVWKPRAFDTDEDANAMLLERMLDTNAIVKMIRQGDGRLLLTVDEIGGIYPNRKLAIRNAYFQWIQQP